MSQGALSVASGSGLAVRGNINAALARLASRASGTSRPSDIATGEDWLETDNPGGGIWSWWLWDGTTDILLGLVDSTTHAVTFYSSGTILGGAQATPQGRLTLETGNPVMDGLGGASAITTIYYTPYVGNSVPLYNGSAFAVYSFTELTNDLTQSSTGKAGPAAASTDKNYDMYVWDDAGTRRLTRSPAWTSDVLRGTGAGTAERQRLNGILTNKYAITNGPAANRGTYVGTIRTDSSSKCNWIIGGVGSAGVAALLHVYNEYNRIEFSGTVGDNTNNWTYTTATWRKAGNAANMFVSYVYGDLEETFFARYDGLASTSVAANPVAVGIGYDSTSAMSGLSGPGMGAANDLQQLTASFQLQDIGAHIVYPLEYSTASGTTTWYGDAGTPSVYQTGLTWRGRF